MSCIYTCPNKILHILELRACCILFTCPTLNLQILESWACGEFYLDPQFLDPEACSHLDPPIFGDWGLFCITVYTHAQPRYSKFWSLGHAVYCIHAQPKTSKLWSLEHVVYTLHMPNPGPPQILEFGECCIFYNPGHQNFGFWSMLYILHMPLPSLAPTNVHLRMLNSVLQRLELGVIWQS